MDNNKLWLLTAKNVGVIPRDERITSSRKKHKLKVRKPVDNVRRNIKVVVSN